jgi:Ca2+-binding RTX toxin-like protein
MIMTKTSVELAALMRASAELSGAQGGTDEAENLLAWPVWGVLVMVGPCLLANRIESYYGNDTLAGMAGNDTYWMDVYDYGGPVQSKTISDTAGIDTLQFQDYAGDEENLNVDLGLLSQNVTAFLQLSLNSATAIENVIGGLGNDVLVGNSLANTLTGGGGNDTLMGAAGNDTYLFDVDSPLGTDSLTDAVGVETISFAGSTAGAALSLGLTTTQIVSSNLSLTLASATTFDNLIGGDGGDDLTGNSAANQLTGGAGNDTLTGGSGNDTYNYDADTPLGNDTLNESGGGIDTMTFATTTTRTITLNLSSTSFQTVNSNLGLTLTTTTGIESVMGGSLSDSITGNSLPNTLTGNAGNDTLSGGGGNDTLTGGAGDDALLGGANDDKYVFDADVVSGSDTIDESAGSGMDLLDFSLTTTLPIAVDISSSTLQTVASGKLSLTIVSAATSIENLTGGAMGDTLTGNDLGNILIGNAGNDTVTGAAGNDVYRFDTDTQQGSDTIDDSTGGIDTFDFALTTIQTITLDLNAVGTQVINANLSLNLFSGVPEIVIGGSKNDILTAAASGSVLIGGAGNDQLTGRAGRDLLFGVAGNDTINGGAGDDLLIAGTTSHDANIVNLILIRSEWVSANDYATRVSNLRAGIGGVSLIAKTNVLNSGVDSLTGGADNDWYFRSLDDLITDLVGGELIDLL